jgi:acyl-CoA thioesterase-2
VTDRVQMDDDEDHPGSIDELLVLLDLEVLDRNLYLAHNPTYPDRLGHLYGGQVAAQAFRAAGLTAPEGRLPHSMHGYFLRAGRSDMPTVLRVDVDRDGRSFSARRVTALQDGEVIFTMSASFQEPVDGLEYQVPIPDVPAPDDLPDHMGLRWGHHGMFDMRPVDEATERDRTPFDVFWIRSPQRLPDDPVLHACVLTYVSDIGFGMTAAVPPGAPIGGASLDHAVWFHRDIRMDDWVLFAMRPISASGERGLYTGELHSIDGVLGATMMQECLMRRRRPS